jgi:hypothetical protein
MLLRRLHEKNEEEIKVEKQTRLLTVHVKAFTQKNSQEITHNKKKKNFKLAN